MGDEPKNKHVTVEVGAKDDISILKYEGKSVLWKNGQLVPDSELDKNTTLTLTGNGQGAKIRIFPNMGSPRLDVQTDNPVLIEGSGFTLANTSTQAAFVNTDDVNLTRMRIGTTTEKGKAQEKQPSRRRPGRDQRTFGGGKAADSFAHTLSTPNDSLTFDERKNERRFVFDDQNGKATAIIVEDGPPEQSLRVDFFSQGKHRFTLTGNEPKAMSMAHWNAARHNALNAVKDVLDVNSPSDPQQFAEDKKRLGIDAKKEKGAVRINWRENDNTTIPATLPLPGLVRGEDKAAKEQPGKKEDKPAQEPKARGAGATEAQNARGEILTLIGDIRRDHGAFIEKRNKIGGRISTLENAAKAMLDENGAPVKSEVQHFHSALNDAIKQIQKTKENRARVADECAEIETKLEQIKATANKSKDLRLSAAGVPEGIFAYADVKTHDENPMQTPTIRNTPGKTPFLG